MKKIIFAFVILLTSLYSYADMVRGVVVVGEYKCKKRDYIVIETNLGFVYAQQYGGSFSRGDEVVGDLNSYGFKDVLVQSSSGRLWIDDYMMSKAKASEKCFGKE
jgi:hypothetical protein